MKKLSDVQFSPEVLERINFLISIFTKEFEVERILLFGSFARGSEGENSSIDILVIARTQAPFYERLKQAIRVSYGDPPVDPIVYTPSEVNQLLREGDSFIDNILNEGVLLYSR